MVVGENAITDVEGFVEVVEEGEASGEGPLDIRVGVTEGRGHGEEASQWPISRLYR